MTKTDELATRAAKLYMITGDPQSIRDALKEYGEHVKSEAVKVCREVATERMTAPTQGFCITNDGLGCAAAIEKMQLP